MAVARIRRVFRLPHESARRDEDDVILKLRIARHIGLRLAQGGPFLRGVEPRAREFADDDRKLRGAELFADISDQVREVLFVFRYGGLRFHAVVPALIPDEAGQFDLRPVVSREILLQVRQGLADFGDHLHVIRTDLAAGARRTEIPVEALASPRGLDEQDLIAIGRADHVTELELRAEMMFAAIHRIADRQSAGQERLLLALIAHPDVLTHDPLTILVAKVGVAFGVARAGHHLDQGALPFVVITPGQVDDRLTFHVRLTREDEDLKLRRRLGRDAQQGPAK